MFYSQFILGKKGPLAAVWISAHWDRKLTKQQIYSTDIQKAVQSIISQEVQGEKIPLALRLSGHLLLGVVRIYSRQVRYLLADCGDTLTKIRLAFRSGGDVDLPAGELQAKENAITLKANLDFDLDLPEPDDFDLFLGDDIERPLNIARPSDIMLSSAIHVEGASHALYSLGAGVLPGFDEELPSMQDQSIEVARGINDEDVLPPMGEMMDFGGDDFEGDVSMGRPNLSLPFEGDNDFFAQTPRSVIMNMDELQVGLSVKRSGGKKKQGTKRKATTRRVPVDRTTMLTINKKSWAHCTKGPEQRKFARDSDATNAAEDEMSLNQLLYVPNSNMAPPLRQMYADSIANAEAMIAESNDQEDDQDQKPMDIEYDVSFGGDDAMQFNAGFEDDLAQGFDDEGGSLGGSIGFDSQNLGQDEEGFSDAGEIEEGDAVGPGKQALASKRSKLFLRYMRKQFEDNNSQIWFHTLVEGKPRATVAGTFLELLNFKSHDLVTLDQANPYGDIRISETQVFVDTDV